MESSIPKAIELTDDLIDYIEATTTKLASKVIPKHIDLVDVKQYVLLQIVNSPPKFDPTNNANVKTLLNITQRQMGYGPRCELLRQTNNWQGAYRRAPRGGKHSVPETKGL